MNLRQRIERIADAARALRPAEEGPCDRLSRALKLTIETGDNAHFEAELVACAEETGQTVDSLIVSLEHLLALTQAGP